MNKDFQIKGHDLNHNSGIDLSRIAPRELRERFRRGEMEFLSTVGVCLGYVQANMIIIPEKYADDFQEFASKNHAPCPILDQTKPGERFIHHLADNANIYTDLSGYCIFKDGVKVAECSDATPYWREDMVGFLIGCSLSFEQALLDNGIRIRYLESGGNDCAYISNIMCEPAGVFDSPMVVSMRPVKPELLDVAYRVTQGFPHVHGGPVYHGDPMGIGIRDINMPEWGDPPEIGPGEIPVFWGCGVTPQLAVTQAKLPIAISHKPCCMFVSDILNSELESVLFGQS